VESRSSDGATSSSAADAALCSVDRGRPISPRRPSSGRVCRRRGRHLLDPQHDVARVRAPRLAGRYAGSNPERDTYCIARQKTARNEGFPRPRSQLPSRPWHEASCPIVGRRSTLPRAVRPRFWADPRPCRGPKASSSVPKRPDIAGHGGTRVHALAPSQACLGRSPRSSCPRCRRSASTRCSAAPRRGQGPRRSSAKPGSAASAGISRATARG
jgi:hypothetical protein